MFEFLKKIVSKKPEAKKVTRKPKPEAKKVTRKPKPEKNEIIHNNPDQLTVTDNADQSRKKDTKSGIFNFTKKIKEGLTKTRESLTKPLNELFSGEKIDAAFYDELEMILLSSDVGISATDYLINKVKDTVSKNRIVDPRELKQILKDHLIELLSTLEKPLKTNIDKPFVIMMVGVNGTGKTTTIGKLTKHLSEQNNSVLIAAGDTFRAAAAEQLQVWGDRNNVSVISQKTGDPSAVVFDAVNSAKAKNIDIVIADTAGRLPTQNHLIKEIAKIKKVMNKCHEGSPHEIILVIDANTGQNAINQLKVFNEALSVNGLVISKLDGSAKGGIVVAIAKEIPTPIRFIGVGEGIDDLRLFSAKEYVNGLID